MEIFLDLWNNWTTLEKISGLSCFCIIFPLLPIAVKVITKNKSLSIFSTLSLLSTALFTLIGIVALRIVFDLEISHIFLLTPLVLIFVNILNIGTCVGYYSMHSKRKGFNLIELKEEYQKDSIQLTILILLLFLSLSIFLTSTFLVFIIFTGFLSLGIIWFNYALLYWLVLK